MIGRAISGTWAEHIRAQLLYGTSPETIIVYQNWDVVDLDRHFTSNDKTIIWRFYSNDGERQLLAETDDRNRAEKWRREYLSENGHDYFCLEKDGEVIDNRKPITE